MSPRRKLVVAERVRNGLQRGQWLCRDWKGRPLATRPARRDALAVGLALALEEAAAACVDLSRFDVRVT